MGEFEDEIEYNQNPRLVVSISLKKEKTWNYFMGLLYWTEIRPTLGYGYESSHKI